MLSKQEARMPGQQRATSVRTWDLRNLEKALEDALTGVLYIDDDQVRYSGPGSARDTSEDWCAAHLWDGDCSWREEWAPYSVPVVEVELKCQGRSGSEQMA